MISAGNSGKTAKIGGSATATVTCYENIERLFVQIGGSAQSCKIQISSQEENLDTVGRCENLFQFCRLSVQNTKYDCNAGCAQEKVVIEDENRLKTT